MSYVMQKGIFGAVALTMLTIGQGAAAEEVEAPRIAMSPLPQASAKMVPANSAGFMGTKPLDLKSLERKRAGTDVFNEMQLKGVVADNRAVNVTTGGNVISDGAFTSQAGIPLVVQNSGNNVLIQNATIVNVQVK